MTNTRFRRHVVMATVVVVGAAAGCSTTRSPAAQPHRPARGAVMRHAPALARIIPSAPDAAVTLRSELEMTLGDHVLLTIELMRDLLGRGPAGRSSAAVDAVQRNTTDLQSLIEQLAGQDAAARFGELWTAHVRQLSTYASALADHDPQTRNVAVTDLAQTEADLGTFLSSATGGRLTVSAAQDAVRMHIRTLVGQADAYSRHDYATSYRLEHEGFNHMVMVADGLASALAATTRMATQELASPHRRLQAALAGLFAEHMGVVVEAMRSAVDRSPDFSSAGAALNANSAQLGDAIGALYGAAAANTFLKLWARHVDALIAYSDATAHHDAMKRASAAASLDTFAADAARFLATATQERLPVSTLTKELTDHDRHLTAQLDAYAAGQFGDADTMAADGYSQMFSLAGTLAGAIGDVVAARLPVGGPQTGGGGMAHVHR